MNSKKSKDLKMGFENEKLLFEKLKTLPFCNDLKLISGYSTIDGKGQFAEVELKTRRNMRHDQYSTALIGVNKIKAFKANGKEHNYIVWKYDDGLFYIKYDDEIFSRFNIAVQSVWRDGKQELSDCYFVPHESFTKLE